MVVIKVVQLGAGTSDSPEKSGENQGDRRAGVFSWFKGTKILSQRTLVTYVPVKMAIEKLRGFVSDQFAQIVSIDDDVITMKADGHATSQTRRKSDRPVPFTITLKFSKIDRAESDSNRTGSQTKVEVVVQPIRARDRRRNDLIERSNQIISSLKAYLMATDEQAGERPMLTPAATESGRD